MCRDEKDFLAVHDLWIPPQVCNAVHNKFKQEMQGRMDKFALEEGLKPWQYSAIWFHTHPGGSASPSGTDEMQWNEPIMQNRQYTVMGIISRDGSDQYARLRVRDWGIECEIDMEVDFSLESGKSDFAAWAMEYRENVEIFKPEPVVVVEGEQALGFTVGGPIPRGYYQGNSQLPKHYQPKTGTTPTSTSGTMTTAGSGDSRVLEKMFDQVKNYGGQGGPDVPIHRTGSRFPTRDAQRGYYMGFRGRMLASDWHRVQKHGWSSRDFENLRFDEKICCTVLADAAHVREEVILKWGVTSVKEAEEKRAKVQAEAMQRKQEEKAGEGRGLAYSGTELDQLPESERIYAECLAALIGWTPEEVVHNQVTEVSEVYGVDEGRGWSTGDYAEMHGHEAVRVNALAHAYDLADQEVLDFGITEMHVPYLHGMLPLEEPENRANWDFPSQDYAVLDLNRKLEALKLASLLHMDVFEIVKNHPLSAAAILGAPPYSSLLFDFLQPDEQEEVARVMTKIVEAGVLDNPLEPHEVALLDIRESIVDKILELKQESEVTA